MFLKHIFLVVMTPTLHSIGLVIDSILKKTYCGHNILIL